MKRFDILVIGGGPGGYSFAINAAKQGRKVALFEKEHLGGTCLNIGCIPTKYLVDKANAMEKVRSLVSKEIFRDAGYFSFKKIQKGKNEVTGKLVGGVRFLLKKHGVEVIEGTARLKKDRIVECGGEEYEGGHVVIATGSVPLMIPVPGHEYCIDSTGALNLTELPRSMVIMGGGVIGLELACAFAAYGTEVTVVEMMTELMPREQKEAVRILVNAIKKQGIRLLTGAKMLRVEKTAEGLKAVYEIDGREEATTCEQVLMAAGRRTNLSGISTSRQVFRVYTLSVMWQAATSWPMPPMPKRMPHWQISLAKISPWAPSPCLSAHIPFPAMPPWVLPPRGQRPPAMSRFWAALPMSQTVWLWPKALRAACS